MKISAYHLIKKKIILEELGILLMKVFDEVRKTSVRIRLYILCKKMTFFKETAYLERKRYEYVTKNTCIKRNSKKTAA